jgi:hypothetical protein
MDPLSVIASVASLVGVCAQLVSKCRGIAESYSDAPQILSSLALECATIRDSLSLVHVYMHKDDAIASPLLSSNDDLAEKFKTALTGCTVTLSVLESELQKIVKDNEPGSEMKASNKVHFVWNQDGLNTRILELRGQRDAFSFLITVVQR